ncbi:hypothetical protein ACFX2J_043979 [Malus domestica]
MKMAANPSRSASILNRTTATTRRRRGVKFWASNVRLPFLKPSLLKGVRTGIADGRLEFGQIWLFGTAIHTLITIAESVKSNGVAVEKSISTSIFVSKLDGEDGRIVLKAQLVILLGKAEEVEETAVPVVAA